MSMLEPSFSGHATPPTSPATPAKSVYATSSAAAEVSSTGSKVSRPSCEATRSSAVVRLRHHVVRARRTVLPPSADQKSGIAVRAATLAWYMPQRIRHDGIAASLFAASSRRNWSSAGRTSHDPPSPSRWHDHSTWVNGK